MATTNIGFAEPSYTILKQYLFYKESTNNYGIIGGAGNMYLGGYQMSAIALETVGYLKTGSHTREGAAAVFNSKNWTGKGGVYSAKDFLDNPKVQELAFRENVSHNYRVLVQGGTIKPGMSDAEKAGYVAAAHLLGAPAINKYGLDRKDGNGVKGRTYYNGVVSAVNAGKFVPGASVKPSSTTAGTTPAYTVTVVDPTSRYDPKVGLTSVPDTVVILGEFTLSELGQSTIGPQPNVLSKYSSFTALWTFSALSHVQVNDPASTYLKGTELGLVIFSSAGRRPDDRIKTAYTSSANATGKFDFFADNFEIELILGPTANISGSNGLTIKFEVIEPYSVGMFLQALQIAARENGFDDYKMAPFLLTLEFIGYNSNNEPELVQQATRHIPFKLSTIDLEITSAGSKYHVDGISWSDSAVLDSHNILVQNTVISGSTVQEMLQLGPRSLQYVINSRLQEIAKTAAASAYNPDEVVILFPKTANFIPTSPTEDNSRATTSNNNSVYSITLQRSSNILVQPTNTVSELGLASMGFDMSRSGQFPKVDDNAAVIEDSGGVINRGLVSADVKSREFVFSQNTTIINAINSVMLMSDYCTKSINNGPNPTTGMYDWFKIETSTYVLNTGDGNKGNNRPPRLLVFRIIPFKVHMSRFQSPTSKPIGYDLISQQVVKEYDYIYTGKNTEVIDFQININSAAFTTQPADAGKYNGDASQQNRFGAGGGSEGTAPVVLNNKYSGATGDAAVGSPSTAATADVYKPSDGSGADNYATLIAKQFQSQLLGGTANEMTAIDLTIHGDPYYISDSGVGNYSNSGTGATQFITSTGAIDYQQGEVDIQINFRTPVDYGLSGVMEFPETTLAIPFSGLYTVQTSKAIFNKGKYTQVLSVTRRLNQDPQNLSNLTSGTASDISEDTARATVSPSAASVTKVQERTPGTVEPLMIDNPSTSFNPVDLGKGLSA